MERKGDFLIATAIFRIETENELSRNDAKKLQTIDPMSDELNLFWLDLFDIAPEKRESTQYVHDICALHISTIKTLFPVGFGYTKIIDENSGSMIVRGHVLDVVELCDNDQIERENNGWIGRTGD